MNKKNLAKFLFIIMLPVSTMIYFLDRFMCVFMFWIRPPKFSDFIADSNLYFHSFVRASILTIIYLLT